MILRSLFIFCFLLDDNIDNTNKKWRTIEGMALGNAVVIERPEVILKYKVELDSTKVETEIQAKVEEKVQLAMGLEGIIKTGTEPKTEVRVKTAGASKPEVKLALVRRDPRDYKVKTYKMTISTKNSQPYVPLTIGSKEYQALVDSGSDMTLMSRKLFDQLLKERLAMTYKQVRKSTQTADSTAMNIKQVANIQFQISKFPMTFPFFVTDGLQMDFLFGYDFMVQTGAVIDFKNNLFTSNAPKVGCRTILEKVSSMNCMIPSFVDGSPKTNEVKFVRGRTVTVLPVIIGSKNFEALLDSASAVSLITERFVKLLKELRQVEKTVKASATVTIGTAAKELTEQVLIRLRIGRLKFKIPFFIAAAMPVDMIIGYDFMSANQVVLDYKTGSLVYEQAAAGESVKSQNAS